MVNHKSDNTALNYLADCVKGPEGARNIITRSPTTSTKKSIAAETVSMPTATIGTTGVVALTYSSISDAINSGVGSLGDSSFAWVTGTILTTEVAYNMQQTDAEQLAAMSNGQWALNYYTGKIRYKKATTGISDTCNYQTREEEAYLDGDIEIGAVEIKNSGSDDRATVTVANTGRSTSSMVLAVQHIDETGAVMAAMDTAANKGFVQVTDGTNVVPILTGTVKTLPTSMHDGTTLITFGTGTTKNVPVGLNDGTTAITFGTGTTKTVPCALTDGTTAITFGTGTTKNVPVGLNDGTTAITFGTGTIKTVPSEISDGTTNVDVIATINSLKSDVSSAGGEALVADNDAGAGVTKVVPVGGKVNTGVGSYTTGDVAMMNFDGKGSVKTVLFDENGYAAGASMGSLESVMINAQSVVAGGTVVGPTVTVDGYKRLTFLFLTDKNCATYIQVSNNGTNWYSPKTVADADIVNTCNNEQIAVQFNEHFCSYVRVLMKNNEAADAATVTATLVAGG